MVAISQLPPLILHPFSGGRSTDDLLEGSQAALTLEAANNTVDEESDLLRQVLVGRYQEIRMLLFLGKDLFRWMHQCVDFVSRSESGVRRVSEQSFATLVVENPPAAVEEKLAKWGVSDRRAIFSRAIGIHSLFSSPPPLESLSPIFLHNYHRYADHAYICFQHLKPFQELRAGQFAFELYASEEYAKILSEQWDGE